MGIDTDYGDTLMHISGNLLKKTSSPRSSRLSKYATWERQRGAIR